MTAVLGHLHIREKLRTLRQEDQLHSCLLFSGPAGIGKSLVARELAGELLCGESDSHALFESGNHPDYFEVNSSDRKQWDTAAIRELLNSLALRGFAGDKRVIVIRDAELLPVQASNALLKSLEEPRPGMYFVLTTSNRSKLLPTIFSRSQNWNFHPLSQEDLSTILQRLSKEQEKEFPGDLESFLDGTLEHLHLLLEQQDLFQEISNALSRVFKGSSSEALRLSNELGRSKDKERILAALLIMRILAGRGLKKASSDQARSRWATFLLGLDQAQYYIFERNLAAAYVLSPLLLELVRPSSSKASVAFWEDKLNFDGASL